MRSLACVLAVLLAQAASLGPVRATTAPASPIVARNADAGAVAALYALRGSAPLWAGSPAADGRRATMLVLLAQEEQAEPAAADVTVLRDRFAHPGQTEQAERELTRAALDYLARRNGGAAIAPARALKALQRLDGAATNSPLALALLELELVQYLGGWHEVGTVPGPDPTATPPAVVSPEIDVAPAMPPRKRLPEPVSLRARLVQSADLSALNLAGDEVDARVTDALRRFQKRHGLVPDGVAGPRTIATLNDPIGPQIAQLRLNLARTVPDRSGLARYVEVNVPGFELRVVAGGRVVLRSRVIVGGKDNETPIFDNRIRYIEINPSWYVPKDIQTELLEKEQQRPGYLDQNGFYWRATADGGQLVQRPGEKNALGRIKFLFPNRHAVYLHDTPQRGLFGRSQRNLSHGCIRVEKPYELALTLLGPDGWDAGRLDRAFAGPKTRRIDLGEPVPVFLDYRTAFVDDEGRLNLRPDLYGLDRDGVIEFAEKGLPPDPVAEPEPIPVINRAPSTGTQTTAMGEHPAPL